MLLWGFLLNATLESEFPGAAAGAGDQLPHHQLGASVLGTLEPRELRRLGAVEHGALPGGDGMGGDWFQRHLKFASKALKSERQCLEQRCMVTYTFFLDTSCKPSSPAVPFKPSVRKVHDIDAEHMAAGASGCPKHMWDLIQVTKVKLHAHTVRLITDVLQRKAPA